MLPLTVAACFKNLGAIAYKQRNAPERRNTNDGEDDSAQHRRTAAADPRHDVEPEKSNTAPVDAADDGNGKSDFVKH